MQFYCAEYGDVQALLTAHREDPYAVRRACVELSRLILARHTVRLDMVGDGQLLPLLVEIVADHAEDQDLVVADCCRFLRRTIALRAPSDLDVQAKITETGILNAMAKAMQCHPRSTTLSIEVCRLTSLLCFDMPFAPHVDNQSDIATAGLFQAICERLQMGTTEAEAQHGVDAVLSIVYEHERNAEVAIETLSLLPILSKLLDRFPSSSRFIQSITQTLFQLTTLQRKFQSTSFERYYLSPGGMEKENAAHAWSNATLWVIITVSFTVSIQRELVNLGLVAQVIEFVHGCENKGQPRSLCGTYAAKDAVCAGEGPYALITATQRIRGSTTASSAKKQAEGSQCHALYYVACMLFCRVAVTGNSASAGTAVHPARIAHLVQAGAHKFALMVVQMAGDVGHVVGQAIRLLELIATVGAYM
uniref:Uncharacterized protein n=1 Tax=Globisporangium ultimum (strain ATCC 200006 / CBS 805.95 / DAOM BR144) TaxID=431595 RepID=K3WA23_GLOUD